MISNVPALLFILSVLTGVIWVLDTCYLAQRRRDRAVLKLERYDARLQQLADPGSQPQQQRQALIERLRTQPAWLSYTAGLFPVFAIIFLLRSFLFEPFNIPSSSMSPTLLEGDFILVNKFSYGIRLPLLDRKIVDIGQPQRGDVMVFHKPDDPSLDYLIKRVIGVPGDRVAYRAKRLTINGQKLKYSALPDYSGLGSVGPTTQFMETLNGVEHRILNLPARPARVIGASAFTGHERCQYDSEGFVCTVPPGHYFMMGDSRDNSNDSRFWGFVPDANIVGKATLVWMNFRHPGQIGAIR